MRVLVRLALAALLFGAIGLGTAQAQQQAGCKQSGNVTPGHIATWTTNCVLQDGGTPANPQITGGIGVASGNQQSICTQNSKSGAVSQLCLGSPPTGGVLTFSTLGGGVPLPFEFVINGVTYTWPFPSAPINVPFLAATSFGVVADGVTSNDVALSNAVNACASANGGAGTALYLPAGKILLNGAATINMRACNVVGVGISAGGDTNGFGSGTTLILTSTSTRPFNCGFFWSWTGFGVYYPNQNGSTFYPPLLSDNGGGACGHATISNVTWVNPYDGIVQVGSANWGDIVVTNSRLFAVRDLLRLSSIGDGLTFTSVRADPGPWLSICAFTCTNQIDVATNGNSFLHATAGATVNISVQASVLSGFRNAILVDSGATVGESDFNAVFEVGSVIDASAGGVYAFQNTMTGQATCAIPKYAVASVKGSPCFTLGANSGLFLSSFIGNASGDFLNMSGGNVYLRGVEVDNSRDVTSTTDYYAIHSTGVGTVGDITVQNSRLNGSPTNVHAHGIVSAGSLGLTIQNNAFLFFNEAISAATAAGPNVITGNESGSTTGSVSIALTGTNQVIHNSNRWDKPPVSTTSSCGTSPPAPATAFSGLFVTGSGSPTSCTLKFPWVPYGFGIGACTFTPIATVTISAAPSAIDTWVVGFSTGYNSAAVYYNCPGQN